MPKYTRPAPEISVAVHGQPQRSPALRAICTAAARKWAADVEAKPKRKRGAA